MSNEHLVEYTYNNNYAVIDLDDNKNIEDNTEIGCAICYEYMTPAQIEGGDQIKVLKCGHKFHTTCINAWIEKKKNDPNCPICRRHITPPQIIPDSVQINDYPDIIVYANRNSIQRMNYSQCICVCLLIFVISMTILLIMVDVF